METPVTSFTQNVVQRTVFGVEAGFSTSTDLFLRTQEGDSVTLSFDSQASFSEFKGATRFEDGATVEEVSTTARAASNYALKVEGELNEEELAAINELAQKVFPIAQSFFTGTDFDIEQAADSLAESLGVINEIELRLEKTTTTAVSAGQFVREVANGEQNPVASGGNPEILGNASAPQITHIRDFPGLVQSVVDSVFLQEEIRSLRNDFIMRSLADLKFLLIDKLMEILAPLNHSDKEEEPEDIEVALPAQAGSQPQADAAPANRPELAVA